jgi:hypothetical protein
MSWTPPSKGNRPLCLGELLRDITDHFLMLTATPHKGDPANFTLFLQLLDRDAYADVKSIKEAMTGVEPLFTSAAPRRPWSISRNASRMAPGRRGVFSPSAFPTRSLSI